MAAPRLPDSADAAFYGPALRWWGAAASGTDAVPRRRSFRPEDLPPAVIPHLILSELHDGGARVRIRLVGSAQRAVDVIDRKGQWMHEFLWTPELVAYHRSVFETLHAARRPMWLTHELHPQGYVYRIERLALPLSDDGATVGYALLVQRTAFSSDDLRIRTTAWMRDPVLKETGRIVL